MPARTSESPSGPGTNIPRPSPNSARPATWPGRRTPSRPADRGQLTATEQQASLSALLPDVLAGKTRAADAAQSLGLAQLCYEKRRYIASARLWAEAFRSQPKLSDDMQAQHRYNAACAAPGRMRPEQGRSAARGRGQGQLAEAGDRVAQGRPGGVVEDPGKRTAPGATGRLSDASALERRSRPGRPTRSGIAGKAPQGRARCLPDDLERSRGTAGQGWWRRRSVRSGPGRESCDQPDPPEGGTTTRSARWVWASRHQPLGRIADNLRPSDTGVPPAAGNRRKSPRRAGGRGRRPGGRRP